MNTLPDSPALDSRESGFSLVELLVVLTISMLMLGSLYTAFAGFQESSTRTARLVNAQEATRSTMQAMARNLRNASQVTRADYDIRFQTDRPDFGIAHSQAGYSARYCLEESSRRVWLQVAPANAPPHGAACPDAGWGAQSRIIAEGVANRADGQARPLFPVANGDRSIRVDLWLRGSPQSAQEVHLESGVFVRSLSQQALEPRQPPECEESTDGGGPLLVIDQTAIVDADGNPLLITVVENGSVIGQGHRVRLTPGTHDLTIIFTDVLGVTTTDQVTVECP